MAELPRQVIITEYKDTEIDTLIHFSRRRSKVSFVRDMSSEPIAIAVK